MARIGIDARLTHYRQGGISQYIYHLIREYAELESANDFLILHSRKDRRDLALAPNQSRISCWTPPHHRLERLALAVEIFPLRLDLLHSPDFIPPYNGSHRSVITVHDLTFLHYPEFLTTESRRYYNQQIESAVARADHILTDSEATRSDVLDMLHTPPHKVTTVLLGIGGEFHPVEEAAIKAFAAIHNLPRGYILFVGTFEPRKNLDGLLCAYAQLRADLKDAPPLVLAGQRGWLYEDLFALCEQLDLGSHVIWLENLPHMDLPALYSGASVLCLPSFYEGFGFPPLEAMACGTPTVVSNRASLPEIVGEAGLLCEPNDPDSIADAIRCVLTDSTLAKELRRRGLIQSATFSWRETAQQTLAIYRQVLEER